MGGGAPILDQFHYRWYDDDNTDEDATTALANEDTSYEVPSADLGASHHLRVKLANTGSMNAQDPFTLQANIDGAGYFTVTTTSSGVRVIAGQPTDGAATAERLTTTARTFGAGEYDDVDGSIDANLSIANDTENVWSIEFRSADLSGGESIDFRVLYNAAVLDTYTVTPNVTIEAGADLISAILPVVYDVVADLKASGDMAATLPVVFGVTADLKATGDLAGVLPIEFGVTASLIDGNLAGPIDAVLPIEFNIAADLKAQGLMSSVLPVEYTVVAALQASGQMGATLPIIFGVVADLQEVAGDISAVLPIEFSLAGSLTDATPAPVADKLADPSIHAKRVPLRRRFYARRWNQFAETFDAFLRRQESLVRTTVQERQDLDELEELQQAVVEEPAFVEELEAVRFKISETIPVTTGELLDALEADVTDLVRVIREEEDILAIVVLIASDEHLH